MILHIPHASTDTLEKNFLCNLDLELERMTDVDTDKLFDHPDATKVTFPISRLICDVERFEDDSMEEMASKGMGVCYTTNSFGEPLRVLEKGEREEIIEHYYKPHHDTLTESVRAELEETGKAIIIDCHSFSNEPLPHENSQSAPRPDICIGADSFHTPVELINKTQEYFESYGYKVAVNDPFSGTLIPMEFYQKDERVQGIMIEVNRGLYRDDFEIVQKNITKWLGTMKG